MSIARDLRAVFIIGSLFGADCAPGSTPSMPLVPVAAQAASGSEQHFFPVTGLTQNTFGPRLIGASPVNPADWPASFYSSSEEGRCTSTVVGPDVLITAAHCIGPSRTVSIALLSGQVVTGLCEVAGKYLTDKSADYAYCKLNVPIRGITYERINQNAAIMQPGMSLRLTGYGCTQKTGAGGNDNIYRAGEARIVLVPPRSSEGVNYITTTGDVVICFGDSGGGGYLITSGARWLETVNSRVEVVNNNITDTSYLSALSTDDARAFTADWKLRTGSMICGIDLVPGCRGSQ
jgi:hypothetical protein